MRSSHHRYQPTEAKLKGGAKEMYITYDLWQGTRGESRALYPKVQRVYIAGKVKDWQSGTFEKRSGKQVRGVKIVYEQSRSGYVREGYTAHRGGTQYQVLATRVGTGRSSFSKIIEVPEDAQSIQFHTGELPERYRDALQAVR